MNPDTYHDVIEAIERFVIDPGLTVDQVIDGLAKLKDELDIRIEYFREHGDYEIVIRRLMRKYGMSHKATQQCMTAFYDPNHILNEGIGGCSLDEFLTRMSQREEFRWK